MKKALYLFAAVAIMFSCQSNKNYTIKGSVSDSAYEGKNVYLQKAIEGGMEKVDTAVISDGVFVFENVSDSTVLRFLSLDESVETKKGTQIPVLVEPGTIEVKFDSVITVSGTKINEDYNNFRTEQANLNNEIRTIIEQYNNANAEGTLTDSLKAEINDAYNRVDSVFKTLTFSFIKENVINELGQFVFASSASMFDFDQQKEVLALMDEASKSQPGIQRIITRIEFAEKVAIGQQFVDFTMKDPQGNDISLSDYAGKGNIVLIDFWAAWCGPCRREMPNVVEAYKKYKNKGFEIVGVSLDDDQELWLKGIKDLKMDWPQMSELKGWKTSVVELYAFNGIPHTVLLDRDGKIIEKNLRGEALHEKLEELTSK